MKLRKFLTVKILLAPELRITAMPMVSLLIVILASAGALSAQPAADQPHPDQQTIQTLMERIDRLEARVAQLEGAKRPPTTETTTQAPSPPDPMPAPVHPKKMERT